MKRKLAQAEAIRTRMRTIESDIKAIEEADPDTEDAEALQARLDQKLLDWETAHEELKPWEDRERKLEAMHSRAASEGNLEDGNDPGDQGDEPAGSTGDSGSQRRQAPNHNRNRDPFADLDSVRTHSLPLNEVRGRAEAAVDRYVKRNDHWALDDEAAENVLNLIHRNGKPFGKAFSEQVLVTGSPEYLAAFEQYLSDPGGFSTRAALSLTPANGGYLVPFTLDPTIILTNAGSANPYRQLATVKTTTTNDWNGVTSAGVSAEWTAEGIEASDASPTVGSLKITPQKADAYLFGSFEVLSDSDFSQQLPGLLADAKDRIEESAFAVGTGTGQPFGVITRATTLAAAAGTAATGFTAADAYAMQAALPARWRGPRANNAWIGNLTSINRGRNLPSFTGSTTPLVTDGPNGPQMLGKPFLESTSVVGAFSNGAKVLAYGDMSQYFIVDRVGMSVVYDNLVLGANRRPTGQGAWYAFWRTGADVSTPTAFRALTLTT
jgi:HK97 family phage major capsid protein